MRVLIAAVASIALSANIALASGESWKPADGPLMTRWAKDVSPENAHPEYPRPQMVRDKWMNLNGLWQLDFGKEDDSPPFGKELSKRILVPFPVESALSGVMEHNDRLWYRRVFRVPEQWSGQRILLHFQAADWETTVYANGREIGSHRGGYDPFTFDVTDALRPSGDQELVVKVFDPTSDGSQPRGKQTLHPKGCFYTAMTGIWQTVWLEPVPESRIGRLLMTPDIDASCLRLTVEGVAAADCSVEAVALDGETEAARTVGKAGEEIKLNIPRAKLKLWSPDSPFLYGLKVTLHRNTEVADQVESYFGMRKIDLGKDENGFTRMRLNNAVLFQAGPLDQGFWPDGIYTAPTDEALRYDIEVTKKLGFNMTRKHVKIEPARWYYWCDKLGLLVWQDMPSCFPVKNEMKPESRKQFEAELARMVDGYRNHPSIIMWVVFNEGWGQHDTPRYVEMVKKQDPSRLASNASGWTDKKAGDILDIHKYPGPEAPPPEQNRAGVLGEFGGLGLAVPGHEWTEKNWGYRKTDNAEQLGRQYEELFSAVYKLIRSHGLSAAVYTQLTDVETECNGLLTYDREVIKVDPARAAAAANRGQ